ncbi:GL21762 [Drosophila persimilis]|uniref:GL21762 n=1 Tax=Drosophila persimilis TaxID=7234 RepID=B4GEQ3_DROPE|nr:GL21762 [Drosophila persimilis]
MTRNDGDAVARRPPDDDKSAAINGDKYQSLCLSLVYRPCLLGPGSWHDASATASASSFDEHSQPDNEKRSKVLLPLMAPDFELL